MLIEVSRPLKVRLREETVNLYPGGPIELTDEDALRLLMKKPDAVRIAEPTVHDDGHNGTPTPPILPGWLVTYRGRDGRLYGGSEDRHMVTVKECRWEAGHWTVHLTNGEQLPLFAIRGVAKTDEDGRILAAWTTREHGYDGEGGMS
jgi:hypothetical protein